MICAELLQKLDTPQKHISFILEQDARYGEAIEEIAKGFMLSGDEAALVPYENANARSAAYDRTKQYLDQVKALCADEKTQYLLMYLFWLHCVPYAKRYYKLLHIDDEVFYATMKDLTYKLKECEAVYGVVGVFVDWFFLLFDMKLFGLGRLEYEIKQFDYDCYCADGVKLKKGDVVYSCHIPSSGPLTQALCLESFQKAYTFFKKDLKGTVLPVVVRSWLLYPPYQGTVFSKDSNTYRFVKLFDTIDQGTTETFAECWRVFDQHYAGTCKELPVDTSMRRRFVDYINAGGTFGWGYGVLLYDGEQKKIINRKA